MKQKVVQSNTVLLGMCILGNRKMYEKLDLKAHTK